MDGRSVSALRPVLALAGLLDRLQQSLEAQLSRSLLHHILDLDVQIPLLASFSSSKDG